MCINISIQLVVLSLQMQLLGANILCLWILAVMEDQDLSSEIKISLLCILKAIQTVETSSRYDSKKEDLISAVLNQYLLTMV